MSPWHPQPGEKCWIEAVEGRDPRPQYTDGQLVAIPHDIVDVLEAVTLCAYGVNFRDGDSDGIGAYVVEASKLIPVAALDCLVKCGRLEDLGHGRYRRRRFPDE